MISLCMIVKDEAESLERCLLSVRPAVAEMVVLDTGSRDATPELARALGAQVFFSDFDRDFGRNFGRARNFALEQATQPWILVLDADEELHPSDLGRLARLAGRGGADAYRLWRYNYMGNGWSLHLLARLFRNHPRIRFSHRMHESVEPAVSALGGRIAEATVAIHHYGFLKPLARQEARDRWYARAEEEELKQRPGDTILRLLLAERYARLGETERALALCREARERDPGQVWGYIVEVQVRLRAGIQSGVEELHRRALEVLAPRDRMRRLVLNSLGKVALEAGRPGEALRLFLEAERYDPGRAHLCVNRGLALERLGRRGPARREFLRALRLNPMLARHPPGMCPEVERSYRAEAETAAGFFGVFHHLVRARYGRGG
ncbi:MAG: glycosyltransferase [Acetobacteraceae bacterium]|nr:glycosyltransferase [Acetobacteraceae bacterium]